MALAQSAQQSDLAASFVIPRPPGPPALVHVFNTGTASSSASPSSIFQVPSSLDTHLVAAALGYRNSQLQLYGASGLGGFLDQQQDLSLLAHSNSDAYGISEEIAFKIINQASACFLF